MAAGRAGCDPEFERGGIAGGPGAGHIIKLLNNFIAQAVCNATAEAFAVGQRAGVDLKQLVALVSVGLVNSGLFQIMAKTLPVMLFREKVLASRLRPTGPLATEKVPN